MRKLPELREREGLKGLPWCVGVSRKRFIGKLTSVPVDAEREEDVKEESGPNYINSAAESKTVEKWEPTLMREDEPRDTDTEAQSSKRIRMRREKKKLAEEGEDKGPSYYHLDIDFNSDTTTTSSSTLRPSYINTDPDPISNSHPDAITAATTINTNTSSRSSSPLNPEIPQTTEPPQSTHETLLSTHHDSTQPTTQNPLNPPAKTTFRPVPPPHTPLHPVTTTPPHPASKNPFNPVAKTTIQLATLQYQPLQRTLRPKIRTTIHHPIPTPKPRRRNAIPHLGHRRRRHGLHPGRGGYSPRA